MTNSPEAIDELEEDHLCVLRQDPVSIFLNAGGGVSIQQDGSDEGEQTVALFSVQAVRAVINRLTFLTVVTEA
jgi:hypothetical protein